MDVRSKFKSKYLGWIIAAILIVVFFVYFFSNLNDFKSLLTVNPAFVVLLLVVLLLGIITNGLFLKWSIVLFGKIIGTKEAIKVSLISTIGNFFAPAGSGLGLRALYLKKQHNLAYSHYMSIVFCNYVIGFSINSMLGLSALVLLGAYDSTNGKILGAFFLVILILSLLSFFIRFNPRERSGVIGRVLGILGRISEGWALMLSHRKRSIMLVMITLINSILVFLGTYFIIMALGIEISLASLVLFSVIGSFSIFINITPGNLGVKEVIYIMLATTIGLTTPQILSIALIDRSALFILILVLSLIFGKELTKFKKTKVRLEDA